MDFKRMQKLAGIKEQEDDVDFDVDLSAPEEWGDPNIEGFVYLPTHHHGPSIGVPEDLYVDDESHLEEWLDHEVASNYYDNEVDQVIENNIENYEDYGEFTEQVVIPFGASTIQVSKFIADVDGYIVYVSMQEGVSTEDGDYYPFGGDPELFFVLSKDPEIETSVIDSLFDSYGHPKMFEVGQELR